MRRKRCRPNTIHYNLLLRAVRDCSIGSEEQAQELLLPAQQSVSKRQIRFSVVMESKRVAPLPDHTTVQSSKPVTASSLSLILICVYWYVCVQYGVCINNSIQKNSLNECVNCRQQWLADTNTMLQWKTPVFTVQHCASTVYAVVVCPSVQPSQTDIFYFSDAKDVHQIGPGSPPTGTPNADAVGKNRLLSTTDSLSKTVQDRCIVSIKVG